MNERQVDLFPEAAPTRAPLTERQRQFVVFLVTSVREKGFVPSYREIGIALGVSSLNCVFGHIKALERKGYLTMGHGKVRAMTLLPAAHAVSPPPSTMRARRSTETLRDLVFGAIKRRGERGATCDELEVELGEPHQTISPRVHELMWRGRIESSGQRPTRFGREASVWVVP